jgi:hypothetical protein
MAAASPALIPLRLWKGETHSIQGCRYHGSSLGGRAIVTICAYLAIFRKIFVVKRTSHLPATNAAAGKTLRRILIFDNHPDSLRLVFGRCAASHASLSDPQGTTSWGVAFLWILVVGLMMAMFWPLF